MILTLLNYRCWLDATFTFPSTQIFHVDGPSESGKSTLFSAIAWVLYSEKGKDPIYNTFHKNKMTCVTLEIDNITFVRKTRPCSYVVTTEDGMKYEGQEAEVYTVRLYGTKEMWKHACSCSQDSLITFFQSSPTATAEYLSKICFPEDDITPTRIIECIDKLSSSTKKEVLLIKHQIDLNNLKLEHLPEYDLTETIETYSSLDLKSSKKELETMKTQNRKSKHSVSSNHENNLRKVSLENELSRNTLPVEPRYYGNATIRKSRDLISQRKEANKEYNHKLYRELEKFKMYDHYSLEELIKGQLSITKEKDLCSKLNIVYDKVYIQELLRQTREKNKQRKLLNSQFVNCNHECKVLLCEKTKLESEQRQLNRKLESIVIVDIEKPIKHQEPKYVDTYELKVKIDKIKRMGDILTCPGCNVSLQLNKDHKLVMPNKLLEETSVDMLEKQLESINLQNKAISVQFNLTVDTYCAQLNKWNKNNLDKERSSQYTIDLSDNTKKLTILNSKLSVLLETQSKLELSVNKEEKEGLQKNHIFQLEQFVYSTVDVVDINKFTMWRKQRELHNIMSTSEHLVEFDNIDHHQIINDIYSYEKELSTYGKNKVSIEKQISNLHFVEVDKEAMNENEKRILKLESLIIETPSILERIKIKSKLTELNMEMKEKTKLISNLSSIKEKTERTEKEHLANIITSINTNMTLICSSIFEGDIMVCIATEKKLLNNKIKRMAHFTVRRDGIEMKYSQMSGGAKSRLKLAFAIAQSHFTKFPYIILDETISSLDEKLRHRCLDILHSHSNQAGKNIIITCHGYVCEEKCTLRLK